MSEIRTKPANDKYRKGFERTFRKKSDTPYWENGMMRQDIDMSKLKRNNAPAQKTIVCCNNDPHFGG